ncbi:hypothetical protein [Aristaeella hokkaidonensis]|uniref:hypothetical protein n=1 Tax=Aristaeella hokkaidonensis TaxID=3046382 RepID=UPI0034E1D2C2
MCTEPGGGTEYPDHRPERPAGRQCGGEHQKPDEVIQKSEFRIKRTQYMKQFL